MKVLIIGKGAVGSAIGTLIEKAGYEVYYDDPMKKIFAEGGLSYDICHITFPMVKKDIWESNVKINFKTFTSRFWVIESSIIPESLDIIKEKLPLGNFLIYSPIRGTESILLKEIKSRKKFFSVVSLPSEVHLYPFLEYMNSVYGETIRFSDAKALAYGKLIEVADFGLQIAFAQMVYFECQRRGYSFEEAYSQYRKYSVYGADYNKLKKGAPVKWIPRGIFRPDEIKGKCVIQDIDLLSGGYGFWEIIKQLNELMKGWKEEMEELKNKNG